MSVLLSDLEPAAEPYEREAFEEGLEAAKAGKGYFDNLYSFAYASGWCEENKRHIAWARGYDSAPVVEASF